MAVRNGAHSPTEQHDEMLQMIQNNHDEAYLYVSQGLSYQEQKQFDLARDMYLKGLEKIEAALSVRSDHSSCAGAKWEHARKLQNKMKKSAEMIKSQLRVVSQGCTNSIPAYTPPEPFEPPPSYNEACEHELLSLHRRSSCPVSNSNMKDLASNGHRRGSSEVVDLFCIPNDVQLFWISYDGSVTAPETQSSLNIYQFVEHETESLVRPPAWLQIGSWTYPLVPGQSPAFESGYGAFLFPNVGAGRDSAVGVILPPSVSPERREEFLRLLNRLTALKGEKQPESWNAGKPEGAAFQDAPQSGSFSETVSRGLVIGAEYLSAGIVKGASISSDLIHKGATKAREKIRPDNTPATVDPRVREGLKIVYETSGVALKATGFLVKKLGELTVALGATLAPHIREKGSKLISSAFKSDPKEAEDTMDGVLTVAAGGLQGFSTIYMGLENAARMLAYSLSSETVNIVGHKYGSEVGEVVGNAVFSVGNLALTTHNVQSLGPKALAKRTAKDAGKAVLKDYAEQVNLPKK